MVEGQNRFDLYQEFAKNRGKSAFRRITPFAISAGVSFPIGFYSMLDLDRTNRWAMENPEASTAVFISLSVSLGVTGIGALAQYLDITRVNSKNGRIAQQIAQLEGRNPQTHTEKAREIRRTRRTVIAARRVGPTAESLVDLELGRTFARLRSRKNPAVAEEKAINDRKYRKWLVSIAEKNEIGYQQNPQTLTDSFILADRQWTEIIENPKQPEHRRRYGRLMQDEIRKKLADRLTAPIQTVKSKENISVEKSSKELLSGLQTLVKEFPENPLAREHSEMDNHNQDLKDGVISPIEWFEAFKEYHTRWAERLKDWDIRDQSPEKKLLFDKLRALVSHSSITEGAQEVLLRELSFLYNEGIEFGSSGLPTMNEPLLNVIGVGDVFGDTNLFDQGYSQEIERRLYTLIKNQRKHKWSPAYRDSHEVKNPLKRWIVNRREDLFELVDLALSGLPEPRLETSWKWRYKSKYKENLKPIK